MNGVQACLTGYVARDADMRYTSTGKGMLTFSLAVDDAKKQQGAESEWVRCVIFGQLAEDLQLRMVKGTHCYVEGRVKLNKWEAADGSERSGLELITWTCQPMGQIGRRNPAAQQEARRAVTERALEGDGIPY